MSDTPKECPATSCPKCRRGLLSPNAPHRGWGCGSSLNHAGGFIQSNVCRIRELEAAALATDAQISDTTS